MMGTPYPRYADTATWLWLLLSGLVGYVIGDYCLMQGYIIIGSRFGQLFMTLSAPSAAIVGRLFLGESMKPVAILGMLVTLAGIAMSILSKPDNPKPNATNPDTPKPDNPKPDNPSNPQNQTTPNLVRRRPTCANNPACGNNPACANNPACTNNPACANNPTPKINSHSLKFNLPLNGIIYASMAGICQGIGLVLSKEGLLHYDTAIASASATGTIAAPPIPVPIDVSVAFASTMIRGIMGLIGFLLLMVLLKNESLTRLRTAVRDRKAMWAVTASMLFGPFIGVSMSLMATRYTSTGIAQTLFALTPVLIIAPAAILFHQKIRPREVIGAIVSVAGAALFFLF